MNGNFRRLIRNLRKLNECSTSPPQECRSPSELLEFLRTPQPLVDWHEDYGEVLWWHLPVTEPPYVGSPLDTDWPLGYYTHWTPILLPKEDRPV